MTSDGVKQLGRVFCVTGYSSSSSSDLIGSASSKTNVIGQSDTESNSSGYLSSSSLESSSEEKRLGLNEQKVFQIWEKWSQQKDQPMNSTPKNLDCTHKKRIDLSVESRKSVLSIKKNLGLKETGKQTEVNDSFWGIVTPQLYKSKSENDMRDECRRRLHHVDSKRDLFNSQRGQGLTKHDAGSIPNISTTRREYVAKPHDWKRKPYHTMSTSDQDLRRSRNSADLSSATESSETGYHSLPRYRVIVDETSSKNAAPSELVSKLSKTCADFTDNGSPVDESMSEFLANVDQDNLASFLNFYDKITNGSAYERARRNPNNYEAVYY